MSPMLSVRYLLGLALAVAVTGTLDAALDEQWDHLVMFAVLGLLIVGLVVRAAGRRPAVPLRCDLVIWLRRRAATTGESLEAVADRAVAAYRDGIDARVGPPAEEKAARQR